MENSGLFWITLFLIGAIYEGYVIVRKVKGHTLSENVRSWFRVQTSRAGRWIFLMAWLVFTAWFAVHIVVNGPGIL